MTSPCILEAVPSYCPCSSWCEFCSGGIHSSWLHELMREECTVLVSLSAIVRTHMRRCQRSTIRVSSKRKTGIEIVKWCLLGSFECPLRKKRADHYSYFWSSLSKYIAVSDEVLDVACVVSYLSAGRHFPSIWWTVLMNSITMTFGADKSGCEWAYIFFHNLWQTLWEVRLDQDVLDDRIRNGAGRRWWSDNIYSARCSIEWSRDETVWFYQAAESRAAFWQWPNLQRKKWIYMIV